MPTRRQLFSAAALPFVGSPIRASQAAGEAAIHLKAEEIRLDLLGAGHPTTLLRYTGAGDPPLVRLARGLPAAITVENALKQPTTLEAVGLRGAKLLQDGKSPTIAPGATATFRLAPPDAGTYWLRPALDGADQAAHGLGAMLVVDDSAPFPVDADIVVVFSDCLFGADGQIVPTLQAAGSPPSTVTLVNGQPTALTRSLAPGTRVRLRLLNASTRRVSVVSCEGARPLLLAIDGQPSELFEPVHDTVPIGPGASFDFVLDMPADPSQTVRFKQKATEQTVGKAESDVVLLSLKTEGVALPPKSAPTALPANPVLPPQIPLEHSRRAELVIDVTGQGEHAVWRITDAAGKLKPGQPVLRLKRGEAVTLGFENRAKEVVALRVEGQAMRLLHPKDDGWEPYWRNTVLLPPASKNHVAFVADTVGSWAIEGCITRQVVGGLRTWFEVSA